MKKNTRFFLLLLCATPLTQAQNVYTGDCTVQYQGRVSTGNGSFQYRYAVQDRITPVAGLGITKGGIRYIGGTEYQSGVDFSNGNRTRYIQFLVNTDQNGNLSSSFCFNTSVDLITSDNKSHPVSCRSFTPEFACKEC